MADEAVTSDDLLALAVELLPGAVAEDCSIVSAGQFHRVVVAPGTGALRVARRPGRLAEFRRVAALTERLATLDLPFAVPVPLGPVAEHEGLALLATAWVEGEPAPRNSPRVAGVRSLLAALTDVDVGELADLLAPPHAYAGGADWQAVLLEEVVPRLPRHLRDDGRRRVAAVAVLDRTSSFVHGDLAGDNVLWDGERVVGVLDWDLAAGWDLAVDAACLAWHGWDTVREVVAEATYQRARTWYRVFGLQQVAADILAGASASTIDATVEDIAAWMERTATTP